MSDIIKREEMTQKTRADYHGKENKYNSRQINKEDIPDVNKLEDDKD